MYKYFSNLENNFEIKNDLNKIDLNQTKESVELPSSKLPQFENLKQVNEPMVLLLLGLTVFFASKVYKDPKGL